MIIKIGGANADTHLQNYERKKLGCTNKTVTSTSTISRGDTLIGDLLHQNMLLIPCAIDPLGRFGPLLQNFLFGQHSAPQLRFPPSRPNATQMYNKLLQYPSPQGILLLANHNWSLYPTRRFYRHSYLAPTPSITTVQSLGVSLIKWTFRTPLLINSLTIYSVFINRLEHHGFLLMSTKIRVVPDVPWCWEARFQ
jgi:hypothetical protein